MIAELDDWMKRLVNEIDTNYPPGPGREALYDVIKQHTSRYEDLKLLLFAQPAEGLDSRWNEEGVFNMISLKTSLTCSVQSHAHG